MAKNNAFINVRRDLMKHLENSTPRIYGAVVLALVEYEIDTDTIENVLALSQEIINKVPHDVIMETVEEKTGICLMTEKQAKAKGE